MPVKAGAFIEKLLKKAGIDTTTEELKPVLALETEITDEIATQADKVLMTAKTAVLHPDVNKTLRQNILGPLDEQMNQGIIEHGLTMNEDFANEPSTYKKFGMYTKALNEKLSKGKGDSNKEEWAKERLELTKSLKAANDLLAEQEKKHASDRENDSINYQLRSLIEPSKLALDDAVDAETKIETALLHVNRKLPAGSKWGLVDGKIAIVNAKDGLPTLADNNEPYQANTFVPGALAQNKLLKVTDANPQPNPASFGSPLPATDKNQAARDAAAQAVASSYGFQAQQ